MVLLEKSKISILGRDNLLTISDLSSEDSTKIAEIEKNTKEVKSRLEYIEDRFEVFKAAIVNRKSERIDIDTVNMRKDSISAILDSIPAHTEKSEE